MGDRRNIIAYILILAAIGVFAGGTGFRFYKERDERVPNTPPEGSERQSISASAPTGAVESKLVCNQLTLFPRQTLGFFFPIDGAPARSSNGFYFVHFGQAQVEEENQRPVFPFPAGGQSGAQALFSSTVYVTEFGADDTPGTADDRTTAIADASFSPIAADGNSFLFGVGEKLMWYSLGPDGIPKTADDTGPKVVAEKYYSNLQAPQGNIGFAGNVAMYATQVSSAPQPSPYSFLPSKNTYAIVYHDFGVDGIPGTSDDYKAEVSKSEYAGFGDVGRTGIFLAGRKLYDIGPNKKFDGGASDGDDRSVEGFWYALSPDGRYAAGSENSGGKKLDVYDVGPDGQVETSDDKRSVIELKNVKPPTTKRWMQTDEFGRTIPNESYDPGTIINYIVNDGPHLIFRREVGVWEYMYAGADGRYGTDDDYVADVVTSTGPDNKKILADQNPHLIGNLLSLDGGFGGTYFYKFCRR